MGRVKAGLAISTTGVVGGLAYIKKGSMQIVRNRPVRAVGWTPTTDQAEVQEVFGRLSNAVKWEIGLAEYAEINFKRKQYSDGWGWRDALLHFAMDAIYTDQLGGELEPSVVASNLTQATTHPRQWLMQHIPAAWSNVTKLAAPSMLVVTVNKTKAEAVATIDMGQFRSWATQQTLITSRRLNLDRVSVLGWTGAEKLVHMANIKQFVYDPSGTTCEIAFEAITDSANPTLRLAIGAQVAAEGGGYPLGSMLAGWYATFDEGEVSVEPVIYRGVYRGTKQLKTK